MTADPGDAAGDLAAPRTLVLDHDAVRRLKGHDPSGPLQQSASAGTHGQLETHDRSWNQGVAVGSEEPAGRRLVAEDLENRLRRGPDQLLIDDYEYAHPDLLPRQVFGPRSGPRPGA